MKKLLYCFCSLFPCLSIAGGIDSSMVEWQSLTGTWEQGAQSYVVVLDWVTAREKGAARFEVERSTDGNVFLALGQLSATGNSTTEQQYGYTDTKPTKVAAYYRVKAIHQTGVVFYSSTVLVEGAIRPNLSLNFPNPITENNDSFVVSIEEQQSLTVMLFSIDGKPLCTFFDGVARKGLYRFNVPRERIPQGMFILRADCEKEVIQKLVLIF